MTCRNVARSLPTFEFYYLDAFAPSPSARKRSLREIGMLSSPSYLRHLPSSPRSPQPMYELAN